MSDKLHTVAELTADGTEPAKREYIGDVQRILFIVEYDPKDSDQPWCVATDNGECGTHHTLDEVLFWELIMGGRVISESLRAQILRDFGEEP